MRKSLFINNKGFSLLEGVVIVVISSIVLVSATSVYIQFLKINNRQGRVIQVERALLSTQSSLKQALTTLPGRGLATSNGQAFSVPALPAAGFLPDATGKITPIRLGIITPYKVNGFDAFTIVYADAKIPRLPIAEVSVGSGTTGRVRVAVPNVGTTTTGGNDDQDPTKGDDKDDKTGRNLVNTDYETEQHQKVPAGGFPTPTPASSPNPRGPRETPTPTKPGVAPNVPDDQTLLGLPWIPSASMFQPGDLALLVAIPPYSEGGNDVPNSRINFQPGSRLVRLTSISDSTVIPGQGGRKFIEFNYDLCTNGDCGGSIPGLSNAPDAPQRFLIGSILVPLKIASFYIKQDQRGSRLIRNRGGAILPDGNGNFFVQGGTETNLGETDSITVTYRLKDGTTQPTPISPIVAWLDDISSIDVSLFREVPPVQGNERIARKITQTYPIFIRNIE
ncbi:MAG: hypothetical protein WAQ98_16310 [Blastocatellia bacterium]